MIASTISLTNDICHRCYEMKLPLGRLHFHKFIQTAIVVTFGDALQEVGIGPTKEGDHGAFGPLGNRRGARRGARPPLAPPARASIRRAPLAPPRPRVSTVRFLGQASFLKPTLS